MRLNLTRAVRCAKCSEPFTRSHGRQKLCEKCQPLWVRAQAARRAAARAPGRRRAIISEARQRERRQDDPVWQAMLTMKCPHGDKFGDCDDIWCRSRREDWAGHDYDPPELALPL
jgi:hypothetical protein